MKPCIARDSSFRVLAKFTELLPSLVSISMRDVETSIILAQGEIEISKGEDLNLNSPRANGCGYLALKNVANDESRSASRQGRK